jgi:hypothetical protein
MRDDVLRQWSYTKAETKWVQHGGGTFDARLGQERCKARRKRSPHGSATWAERDLHNLERKLAWVRDSVRNGAA